MKKMLQSMLIVAALVGSAVAAESENFGGLGISVWTGKSGVKVAGVIPNSPAESIGLQAGDLILSANGTDLSAIEPNVQISYLRGEAGTSIAITVNRNGETLTLSTKRVELAVQSLDAGDITAWYGKSNGLTAEEINFLASQKATEGYELLAVMQHGIPLNSSAENLSANYVQQISVKKAEQAILPEVQPIQNNVADYNLSLKAQAAPLVNAKGAYVKKQGHGPVFRLK